MTETLGTIRPASNPCPYCSGSGRLNPGFGLVGLCPACLGSRGDTGRQRAVCRHCGAWPDEPCRRGIGEPCLGKTEG